LTCQSAKIPLAHSLKAVAAYKAATAFNWGVKCVNADNVSERFNSIVLITESKLKLCNIKAKTEKLLTTSSARK
jgi:hypothetical protein